MSELSENQILNISETLKDFKSLLNRYNEVKNDSVLLDKFASRNRNPLYDITSCKYFDTGVISENALKMSPKEQVKDHYIQRKFAVIFIFSGLSRKPDMSFDDFLIYLRLLCSTVTITKTEHKLVTTFATKNNKLNFEAYPNVNVKLCGFSEYLDKFSLTENKILSVLEDCLKTHKLVNQ